MENKVIQKRKNILIPPMDVFCAPLLAASMRSEGYHAKVLTENENSFALGLKHTSGGECVPCPLTLGALLMEMQENNLAPEQTVFFMPTACGPCRFGQYVKLTSLILERTGRGAVEILSPSSTNAYSGLDRKLRARLWHAVVIGDILRKLEMKTRPYEKTPGETGHIIRTALQDMEHIFETKDITPATARLAKLVDELSRVQRKQEQRPLIGVVGEIYVRCDPFINGNLCRKIEEMGGEAWLAPIAEWILYTNFIKNVTLKKNADIKSRITILRTWLEQNFFFEKWERHYYSVATPLLHDRKEHHIADVVKAGACWLPPEFEGESILTLGRGILFASRDNARAIVNVSPMFCMPGTITTSIFPKIEKQYKTPVLSVFYDGSGDPNQRLIPVMHYLCRQTSNLSA